jgi:hypothetical protein
MIKLSMSSLDQPLGRVRNWYMNTNNMSDLADPAAEEAIKLFESHPKFPRVVVRMRERLEELGKSLSPEATRYGSQARVEFVIERNEIRAKAFWELVDDINTLNAFSALLRRMVRAGFQEYTGFSIDGARAVGQECQRVEALMQLVPKWEQAGYERLAKRSGYTPGLESDDAPASIAQQRRTEVDDYIAEVATKTGQMITRTDIWKAAGYTEGTQFERWERNNNRSTVRAERNIRKVLQGKLHLNKT